jgi:hypothetical protein
MTLTEFLTALHNLQWRVIDQHAKQKQNQNVSFAEYEYILWAIRVCKQAATLYGTGPLALS